LQRSNDALFQLFATTIDIEKSGSSQLESMARRKLHVLLGDPVFLFPGLSSAPQCIPDSQGQQASLLSLEFEAFSYAVSHQDNVAVSRCETRSRESGLGGCGESPKRQKTSLRG
jgi:hypothetical protein